MRTVVWYPMNQYGSDVRCLTECSMIYFDCLKYVLKLPLFGKAVMKRILYLIPVGILRTK